MDFIPMAAVNPRMVIVFWFFEYWGYRGDWHLKFGRVSIFVFKDKSVRGEETRNRME